MEKRPEDEMQKKIYLRGTDKVKVFLYAIAIAIIRDMYLYCNMYEIFPHLYGERMRESAS